MKKTIKLFSMLLLTGFIGILNSCNEEEALPPSEPQLTSDISTLAVKKNESKLITVTIIAAGKIKSAEVTTTIGESTFELTGVNEVNGSLKINYKAPLSNGTGTITVKVTDQVDQISSMPIDITVTDQDPIIHLAGDVDGVWEPASIHIVRGNLKIPAGKTLTIKEGVTVIVEGNGTQGGSPGITAEGSFYAYGTKEFPILITVPQSSRVKANIFKGLWAGIAGTATTPEMVILYTRLEYAGSPAEANHYMVTSGELKEGDPHNAVYFTNPNGKFVMMNSTIAYTKDDGMRINQGQFLVAYNIYVYNGESGGESLNIKSGSRGDVAFNVFFQPATNGIKYSNSDKRDIQADVYVYNNTAINGGWRQTKSGRGGSFNPEKGVRGKNFNNMAVNCRFGLRTPAGNDAPDWANFEAGFTFYFGNTQDIVNGFYPTNISTITPDSEIASTDIKGTGPGTNDPLFVNFNPATFNSENAKVAANLDFPAAMDLRLKSGSPALNRGKTNFSPRWPNIVAGGKTYTTPVPASYVGAYGTN